MTSSETTSEPGVARRIVALLGERARGARVADVRIGLGYTAVEFADRRCGVAYTFRREARGGCSVFYGVRPLAGRPASDLRPDDRVAMVGSFGPSLGPLRGRVRELTVFERVARPQGFLSPAGEAETELPRCQVALITATAILNGTIDGLLHAVRRCRTVAVLGASTPMLPGAFAETPADLLSGVVVVKPSEVLRIVSEGGGMRQFKGHVRKVNLDVRGSRREGPVVGTR